jgi:hypothetical protein
MTKINKSITSKLYSIIQKCIANNLNANIIIQKLGNIFFQHSTNGYSTCFLSCVFFTIISCISKNSIHRYFFLKKYFCVKTTVTLNKWKLDSTYILCSSIIDKYINHSIQYEYLSLANFILFYKIKKIQNITNPKLLGL